MNERPVCLFWFRRDLRLHDNAGLYQALQSGIPVQPIFIFDTQILERLEDRSDKRVDFIHRTLNRLHDELKHYGCGLIVRYGKPEDVFLTLVQELNVKAVYTNHDYEPYAQNRDQRISEFLASRNIAFHTFKDQCIFEKDEVLKDDGMPYTVFTPYSRKWKTVLNTELLKRWPSEECLAKLYASSDSELIPSLQELGFHRTELVIPDVKVADTLLESYGDTRDIPSITGTSRLSVHLRFGTVSIRELAQRAFNLSETFLNELIWRDFYMMILWHFPHVAKSAFKPKYERIRWENNESHFSAWCNGETGYPLVDAGMRELNATGFMHNRVRMVVASFLTKHLLIDWRWGEAYFAKKLLDFDLSANNGGWQWASGSGCDAAPYFRVFNPTAQTEKFDPELKYIRRWVPELEELTYPLPIVEHRLARERAIARYKEALVV